MDCDKLVRGRSAGRDPPCGPATTPAGGKQSAVDTVSREQEIPGLRRFLGGPVAQRRAGFTAGGHSSERGRTGGAPYGVRSRVPPLFHLSSDIHPLHPQALA